MQLSQNNENKFEQSDNIKSNIDFYDELFFN